ncbi:predicted protein [Sclerotinia sclerotiorum 1980 UF-70]|uniref:Uncharacterized protein n=1 Tax=Sclerotinia sclerotiorum (strain ATCC 18683 / 1980 / Ss-1) TaxID=665079 RepID=A7E6X1_SCLS1|nr:predicted protein [Sclerotinia sclerotiorum 1980 UF-70]EDN91643.1 predicted protein [Sclerotinia sclerotiorum 1980 UF-70]
MSPALQMVDTFRLGVPRSNEDRSVMLDVEALTAFEFFNVMGGE